MNNWKRAELIWANILFCLFVICVGVFGQMGGDAGGLQVTRANSSITNNTGTVKFDIVRANQVNAVSAAGLDLCDDDGNGIHVKDGGDTGVGDNNPSEMLSVRGNINLTANANSSIYTLNAKNLTLYADDMSHSLTLGRTTNVAILRDYKIVLNENGYGDVLTVDGGKVGIYNNDPDYLLEMEASGGGYYDTSDHDWHTGSSHRSIKTNIQPTDNLDALSILKDVKVRKGRYRRWQDRFEAQTNRIAKIEQKQVDSNTVAIVTNMVDKVEMVKVGQEEIEPGPEVLMYVVDELPQAMPHCVISTNGNLGMRQAFLILTKAIQQQQQQIDALNKRIKTLEDAR